MSEIKIHELPEMRYTDTTDTDILVLENSEDTWHIPLGDLKILFGNDAKIDAIYNDLLNRIAELSTNTGNAFEDITQDISSIKIQLENIGENINQFNNRLTLVENHVNSMQNDLTALTERVSANEVSIKNINTAIDQHNDRLIALEDVTSTHTTQIEQLQKTDEIHTEEINNLKNKVDDLQQQIDDLNAVSKDTIDQVQNDLTELIIQKYEELLGLIDECHHQVPIIE